MPTSADFLFFAPLDEERQALLAELPEPRHLPPEQDSVLVYDQAELPVQLADGTSGTYEVVVVSPLGMGRVSAATAMSEALRLFTPRYVLLVGIAGGVAERTALGDVLISDQIVDYELQKITPTAPEVRYKVYQADAALLAAAKSRVANSWNEGMLTKRPRRGIPVAHFGPVASGDKVIAAREILSTYQQAWPKLLGVEMEAGGVAGAVATRAQSPGLLMVRGVSDLADQNKAGAEATKWRGYACAVAARYALALLRSGPVVFAGSLNVSRTQSARSGTTTVQSQQAGTIRIEGPGNTVIIPQGAHDSERGRTGTTAHALPEPRRTFLPVERPALADAMLDRLDRHKGLLLLAPHRGGARTLVEEVIQRGAFAEATLTRLQPPGAAQRVADYFRGLTGQAEIVDGVAFQRWLVRRIGRGRHLVVLRHDAGPAEALHQLAAVLRSLMEERGQNFKVLAAGEERAAALRLENYKLSLFNNLYVEYVPNLSEADTATVLRNNGRDPGMIWADRMVRLCGGHPGSLRDALDSWPDEAAMAEPVYDRALARLKFRLKEDDRDSRKERLHAATVLQALLGGRSARSLKTIQDDLEFAETRLYFDAIVRAGIEGQTEFRCEPVQRAAGDALEIWQAKR